MLQRPQHGDPFWIWMLHWWDLLSWAVIGLLILLTALADLPDAVKYGSLALLALLASSYTLVRRLPGNPVRRGYAHLIVLLVTLAALSYLRDGYGVLYTLALPQFVIFVDSFRAAIVLSGLGATAITVGGTLRQGWGAENLTTNTISSLAVYAVSVLIALLTPRALAARDERAELRAKLATAQLGLAEAHRLQGAAEERERLAREIHDTLAQGFASIIVLAEAARSSLATDPNRSSQQLLSIEQTARENFAEARVLVGAAPQSGLTPGSVAATLRRTLDRFTEDTGLHVIADLEEVQCDQPTRIALLRCTQESLANVRKHAAASTVDVVLAQRPYGVELDITDDGQGFVVEEARGFGLGGMRKRLAELGGELTVTSSVGDGTRVLALIPTNGEA
ncbi:sensor histidine kinase [Streptomyces sp. NBC_00091]|uniref:sensor histidine kinase n=1 Tax=Streptomyces sp. NBC_00091 TaxID=2975648 RepID=UPI00224DF765|nr:sensor histidine kinase [Streptomyces sp. NBC_00091]MCX5380466.1 sensor histidine kinase [Streptomyces sp. NBC_00091]